MSKNLSQSELNVLQENLDLFSGAAPAEQAPDSEAAPARQARRPVIQRDNSRNNGSKPGQGTATTKPRKQAPAKQPQAATAGTSARRPQTRTRQPEAAHEPASASAPPTITTPDDSRHYSASGRQILGVRCSSATQAREWLITQGISIENYAIEKRDPALRNLAEALLERGVEYRTEGGTLEWFLISSEQPSSELLSLPAVELAFSVDWFENRKAHIRRLKGGDYIDACGAIADHLPLGQRQPEDLEPA